MKPGYDDTHQRPLDIGCRIMTVRDFPGVDLNEILQTTGVPRGSLYCYLRSKEQFGQIPSEDYFHIYLAGMDQRFSTSGLSAHERLMNYWQKQLDNACPPCDEQRCLMVEFNAEAAGLSESMHITLRDGSDGVIRRLVGCLGQGRDDGSLAPYDAQHMTSVLYRLWLSASLLSKLHRSPRLLETAMQIIRSLLEI